MVQLYYTNVLTYIQYINTSKLYLSIRQIKTTTGFGGCMDGDQWMLYDILLRANIFTVFRINCRTVYFPQNSKTCLILHLSNLTLCLILHISMTRTI